MYCMIHIQNFVYYCKIRHVQPYSRLLRHIQPYCGTFKTLYTTLAYSESWHIQNPKYIQNSVKVYSGIFRTLCNDPCQNFGICRARGIFRILLIQVQSGIFSNCQPSGRLYSPARMRNSIQKKSHNFYKLPVFSILYNDFLKLQENRDKQFKLGPSYFNFPRTGNYIISGTLVI